MRKLLVTLFLSGFFMSCETMDNDPKRNAGNFKFNEFLESL